MTVYHANMVAVVTVCILWVSMQCECSLIVHLKIGLELVYYIHVALVCIYACITILLVLQFDVIMAERVCSADRSQQRLACTSVQMHFKLYPITFCWETMHARTFLVTGVNSKLASEGILQCTCTCTCTHPYTCKDT